MFPRHQHENKILNAKSYDSEPFVYQTKFTVREVHQMDREF